MNNFLEGFCSEMEKISMLAPGMVSSFTRVTPAGLSLFKKNPQSFQKIYGSELFQKLTQQSAKSGGQLKL